MVNRGNLTSSVIQPTVTAPASPPLPARQPSVDAEAIRIVIHDVDSAGAARRRVVLRRDPADKAHRSKSILLILVIHFYFIR